MAVPSRLLFCLLDLQLGNVCILPQLHFGRLATGLRPVLLSSTFLCYPRATFFWRVPSICLIFLHLASLPMLCLVGWYQANSGSLCIGTPVKTWISPCLVLSKGMLLPSMRTLLTIASLHNFQANVKFSPFPKASLSTYSCLLLPWHSGETVTNSSLQLTVYGCVAITKEIVIILTKNPPECDL